MYGKDDSAVLLVHCPDRPGIIAAVTDFIREHNGNILDLDQHVDRDVFFMRLEWDPGELNTADDKLANQFRDSLAQPFDMTWELYRSDKRERMALLVSRHGHCLYDMLARHESGELAVDLPVIISNHEDLAPVAQRFGIPFHHLPVTAATKAEQERAIVEILEANAVDFVVLARYMQILTPGFVDRYHNRIINIHHSFLPAFPGGRPYHSAHERGVKIIGATSHYVTADLDAGPIIEQDVVTVSHRDSVQDMIVKGRDLEKIVLGRAVKHHVERKVLVFDNRTVVFS